MIRARRAVWAMCLIVSAGLGWSCARPTAKLKVSRDQIKQGEPVTVSWETKNAKSVELNGRKVERIGAQTMTPSQTTSYVIMAKRGKKEARDRAMVRVDLAKKPAPSFSLRAEPDAVERGKNTQLQWSAENARTITISGLGEVPASGKRMVSPQVSTTYTGTAIGDGGTASASTRVTVVERPAPVAERPRTSSNETSLAVVQQFRNAVAPIYFDLDKAELNLSEQEKLSRAAAWLLEDTRRTISFRIEGNCDPRGTEEYNLGLGDRRARMAKEFLVGLGIDPKRIDTISYGIQNAQGANEGSPEIVPSWAHDRRDDFVYLSGGQLP
ncbi:MAG TPA: OmpA family protein [Blastocatellia bacterium]|nr:OmpA family protein [Blastocatellia bacterium]